MREAAKRRRVSLGGGRRAVERVGLGTGWFGWGKRWEEDWDLWRVVKASCWRGTCRRRGKSRVVDGLRERIEGVVGAWV